jgi:ABC-type transporter Mla subunit MlaD
MARPHDNFKAGLFVLTGLALAIAIVLLLTNVSSLWQSTREIDVYYSIADGLLGLKDGSQVTLGDQPIGHVKEIFDTTTTPDQGTPTTRTKDDTSPIVGKIVRAVVPAKLSIYMNARIEVIAPAIGSGTRMNIRSVGYGQPYQSDRVIAGSVGGNPLVETLARNVGIADKQREEIRQTIANIRLLTRALTTDIKDLPAGEKPIPLHQTVDHVQRVAAKFDEEFPKLLEDVRAALADVKSAVADARSVIAEAKQKVPTWAARVDESLDNTRDTTARLRKAVEDKEPGFRKVVDNAVTASDNAKQFTASLNEKTLVQVSDALEAANKAMENIKSLSGDARGLIASQRPVVERALANASLTTEQLKLAAVEVRRSPWRLLYSPKDKELETDNLYDAARSFALAAGTLDSAAQSLRAVTKDSTTAQDPAEARKVLDYLEKVFVKYQDAEARFWKALGEQAK